MNSHRIAILVALLASVCAAHIGGLVPSQDLTQVYCGRTLAKALALLCYDDIPMRSADVGMYSAVLSPYYKEQEQGEWPWEAPYKARSLSIQRGKRQVVSECCDKPCSINELLTYC